MYMHGLEATVLLSTTLVGRETKYILAILGRRRLSLGYFRLLKAPPGHPRQPKRDLHHTGRHLAPCYDVISRWKRW